MRCIHNAVFKFKIITSFTYNCKDETIKTHFIMPESMQTANKRYLSQTNSWEDDNDFPILLSRDMET